MQPDSDDYRGCWNCIYHDDAEGFETHCAYSKSNNITIHLRCPAWVNKEKIYDTNQISRICRNAIKRP